jgi:hypothetical protein
MRIDQFLHLKTRISIKLKDATQIASNQRNTLWWILKVFFTYKVHFKWPWSLHNDFEWALSEGYLPIILFVWHMIKICSIHDGEVIIVHVLTDLDLSKWPWGILVLKINNFWCIVQIPLAFLFWVTLTF